MDRDAFQAFLAQPHDAIISTNRVGKGSQLSPVWLVWDGESFLFSTQKASVKYANIVRELSNAILEKYIPADQRQQFEASNQEISRASRVVIVLKPEKVVGWAWTAL
jgi:pyridoxamine 5'-phosphate oxidase-like protein